MAELPVSGGTIRWEQAGGGVPLVLVHGSWDELAVWERVTRPLSECFRVVTYDRRGHGGSRGAGPLERDVEDLATLIEHVGPPAHVAANSFGGAVALRLAARRPELLRQLAVHEPPLIDLLGQDHPASAEIRARLAAVVALLDTGRQEEGARTFVERVAFGPGAWARLPADTRAMMVRNAHTFLEESQEPLSIDTAALARISAPVLLSGGEESPPFFADILDLLERTIPGARRATIEGTAHVPHETHPAAYAALLRRELAD